MLGNVKNASRKLIDEKEIVAICVKYSDLESLYIADSIFGEARKQLNKQHDRSLLMAQALAIVFDAGRVQGIREERSRKHGKGKE